MKKIAIYFSDPEPMGYPFNTKYPYWEVFKDISSSIEKQGIGVYFVRGDSYLGKGKFSHGWQIKDQSLISIAEPITVNLIFHRGNNKTIFPNDCLIINHPDLERFCDDKLKAAEFFPEFSPKTKAINSYQEYVSAVAQWNFNAEDKIVLKKNFLSGGSGVNILPVKNITEALYENWNDILVQEFVDSSVGIPGIVEGLHDIRVVTINSEVVYAFVRIPPPGSFLANVSRGGSERAVPLAKLPPQLLEMVAVVNKKLTHYQPSIFASDFFNSKSGFKLIELNAPPAVCDPRQSPETRNYIDKTIQFLVDEVLKR
jgi:glutathione synthase/RimK-type ligase-like ATP-grasp enzyme